MSYDVFISYSIEDKTIADSVSDYLEDEDIRCWVSPRNISSTDALDKIVKKAIESSKVFLYIISPFLIESARVNKERLIADSKGIPVIRLDIRNNKTSYKNQFTDNSKLLNEIKEHINQKNLEKSSKHEEKENLTDSSHEILDRPLIQELIHEITDDNRNSILIVKCLLEGKIIAEDISEETGINLKIVKKILYKLYNAGFASYKRIKDPETQWYTYSWTFEKEKVIETIYQNYEKNSREFEESHAYKESNMFFTCTNGCRYNFEEAAEYNFICPKCNKVLECINESEAVTELKDQLCDEIGLKSRKQFPNHYKQTQSIEMPNLEYDYENMLFKCSNGCIYNFEEASKENFICPKCGKILEYIDSLNLTKPGTNSKDNVHFTVTSPSTVTPNKFFTIELWAHLKSQQNEVINQAKTHIRGSEIYNKSKGPVKVAKETTLKAELNIKNAIIEDKEDFILWTGEIGNADFRVKIPEDIKENEIPGKFTIYINDLKIAHINFEIEIGDEFSDNKELSSSEVIYKKAFASYSSEDRNEVLARIHGMEKVAPNLKIFMDVNNLRSGDNWKQRLKEEISSCDVFYLFWSENALQSEWVEKEWKCALKTHGIDIIDPVPLVCPKKAPVPPELSDKHFNDRFLAFNEDC